MDDEVEAAELLVDRREHRVHLRVDGDVTGQDQRIVQCLGELADVLFETLALVGHCQTRAGRRRRLRDGPRDRALVRDADDEPRLSTQICHSLPSLSA